MARRLTTFVHVHDDEGVSHAFGPDSTVPAWAAKKITNKAVWEGSEDAAATSTPASTRADPATDPDSSTDGGSGDESGGTDGDGGNTPPPALPDGIDEESTVKELREYAKAKEINLHGATSKEDILAAISSPQ